MGKLMKYELFRRSKLLIIMAIILVFIEGACIYGLYRGGDWLVLFFLMMGLMLFGAFLFPLIDAIVNYYSDFKHTHGYMLFLTPSSGYQIIGSKALFALIELVVAIGVVGGFYTANYYIAQAFGYADAISAIQLVWNQIPAQLGTSTAGLISLGAVSAILQYFNVIMMAITAVTLSKTLLSQKSFSWLIALLFYIGLAMAIQTINGLVFSVFGLAKDILDAVSHDAIIINITKYALISIGLYVIWIGGGYTASSMLINSRVDL